MSFFAVDYAFFVFFLTFFCTLCELLVFFRIFCCGFSCLDAFSSFLPCLSKTKLTGGLARAGAARRRWKSGLWVCGVFWRLKLWRSADFGFFSVGPAAFLMERKAELRRDGVAVFVGPCAFCLFFRVVRSCFLFWFLHCWAGVAVFLYASIEQTLFFLYNGSLG